MNIIIAMSCSEISQVKYITLSSDLSYEEVGILLKNFYSKKERVEALINLGNLSLLGPSPSEPYKGEGDEINCKSAIRDEGLSASDNQFKTTTIDALPNLPDKCYLFRYDYWQYYQRKRWQSVYYYSNSIKAKDEDLNGVKLYKLADKEGLAQVDSNFTSWQHIQAHAAMKDTTYYAFQNNKLTKIIN